MKSAAAASAHANASTRPPRTLLRVAAIAALGGAMALAASVTSAQVAGRLYLDSELPAGTHIEQGALLMHTPRTLEVGSSVSHWDPLASPDLLMEPAIGTTPASGLDLTPYALADLGWALLGGAQIEILYEDGPDTGFNDPFLGEDRRAALESATSLWSDYLFSAVPIRVAASFDPLPCDPGGAVLAQAGAVTAFRLAHPVHGQTWYPGALAEAVLASDISTVLGASVPEITLSFNDAIDGGCMSEELVFDYDLEGHGDGRPHFRTVALHEMAHGLGFGGFVDLSSGDHLLGEPDIYSHHLYDFTMGVTWAEMTPSQRVLSATNSGEVVWLGDNTLDESSHHLEAGPALELTTPHELAGVYRVAQATFGPRLEEHAEHSYLARVDDGTATPERGCYAPINAHDLEGRIAVAARGNCDFTQKAVQAQHAGAVALIVVNDQPAVFEMGFSDAEEAALVDIPVLMISSTDGAALLDALETGADSPAACHPSDTVACVQGDRFSISVEWSVGESSGHARAGTLGADSAFFWFFSPTNVELLVKVLDGCGFEDPHFWVFAAGLTDVGVQIAVHDTQTGEVRHYESVEGGSFSPVQDLEAFAGCQP